MTALPLPGRAATPTVMMTVSAAASGTSSAAVFNFGIPAGATGSPGAAATVAAGVAADGFGMMINSSRAILYAGAGEDFADAARQAARLTRDEINRCRVLP